jgi:hypothetical protein
MQPISKGWISSDISVLQPGKWIQRGDSGVLSEEFGEEVEKCLQVLKLTDCSGKPLESQHHAAIQAIFLTKLPKIRAKGGRDFWSHLTLKTDTTDHATNSY